MEYRGFPIDPRGPFSVESARQGAGSVTHPGSRGLLKNGPDSGQLRGFSEANTIAHFEDGWVPVVRAPAGQAISYQPGGIDARVEIYPPTHVHGRGKYGFYCIGERGEEVALSNGEMNRAE